MNSMAISVTVRVTQYVNYAKTFAIKGSINIC